MDRFNTNSDLFYVYDRNQVDPECYGLALLDFLYKGALSRHRKLAAAERAAKQWARKLPDAQIAIADADGHTRGVDIVSPAQPASMFRVLNKFYGDMEKFNTKQDAMEYLHGHELAQFVMTPDGRIYDREGNRKQ